jgi:hypothetical protein
MDKGILAFDFIDLDPDLLAEYKVERHKKTPWPESASELYRPSDRRLSVK